MDKIICEMFNKYYSPKYILQHKKTLNHIENSFEYDLENNVKQHFSKYFS